MTHNNSIACIVITGIIFCLRSLQSALSIGLPWAVRGSVFVEKAFPPPLDMASALESLFTFHNRTARNVAVKRTEPH